MGAYLCLECLLSWGPRLVHGLPPGLARRFRHLGRVSLVDGLRIAACVTGSTWSAVSALALGGLRLGMFATPFFSTALERVRPHETGSASLA